MPAVLSVDTALQIVRGECAALPAQELPLREAEGRVLAADVCAAADLPPFDNAAMDGYALRAGEDFAVGRVLAIHSERAAGDAPGEATGSACAIMTGAPLPPGFDRVIPVEDVDVLEREADGRPRQIRIEFAPRPGQHVRRAGQDIALGSTILRAGSRLGATELMVLRGSGVGKVQVRRRPRLALACTGRELVDADGAALAAGQIHNTNGPYLAAQLRDAGADVAAVATLPDQPEALAEAISRWTAQGVEAIVSTGAVSMGRYDFVPELLRSLGARILVHKLHMRPGKPLLFARLPNGALYFGLPGNPVSSALGARLFISAAIRRWLGMDDERSWRIPLQQDVDKKPGPRLFQKAELCLHADGRLRVRLLQGQESFRIRPLLAMRLWAALPEGRDRLQAGESIDTYPLCHFDGALFEQE